MTREVIGALWGRKNLNALNNNFEELYNSIESTELRITNNLWKEMKDINSIKMIDPVATYDNLPETAKRNTLIVVLDEQKVYAYVNESWQPFNEIDLDPFEPFKKELSDIISEYESRISTITKEVLDTKENAINHINNKQSESESNITTTKNEAVDAINTSHNEAERQAQSNKQELLEKTRTFTNKFNTYLQRLKETLDNYLSQSEQNKNQGISDLENVKNNAIESIKALNAKDTSDWQKYNMTQDNGSVKYVNLSNDIEKMHKLEPGFYYTVNTPINIPGITIAGFLKVFHRTDGDEVKTIEYRPYNDNITAIKYFYKEWSDWKLPKGSHVELFNGAIKGVGRNINLKDSYKNYSFLKVTCNGPGGDFNVEGDVITGGSIMLSQLNLTDDNGSVATAYEGQLTYKDDTTLTINNDVAQNLNTKSHYGDKANRVTVKRIVGVA
ncbi:hypothetical protein BU107_07065 [Staphylococcus xylosus]|uniref:hypothetical protein n=1 Tax=Staphylococcus xylosus TaxID=1288 RepID=UPI000E6A5806|nr:hypothetical protein [Staphylococcus xylosus]RIM87766.1 hypothetical protein BU107_07065 [Staphylococcus xylosus]